MKKFFIFGIFLLAGLALFSQGPYLGGEADGYASKEAQVGTIVTPEVPKVLVFPTLMQQGKIVQVVLNDLQNTFELRLVDALGQVLLEEKQTGVIGKKEIQLVTDKLAAGIYLLEILRDQEISSHKLVILNE